MRRSGFHAVIPVKSFASAKQRMSPFLSAGERAHLARVMFHDVLDAVRSASRLEGYVVVTHSACVAAVARRFGFQVIDPESDSGLSAAVSCAVAALPPGAGMIVIPSDIPHINPALIDHIAALTPSPGVVLVPATVDGGTNILAMRPCTLLPPQFGPDSFARHRSAAVKAGVTPLVWRCPRAGRDLDRAADLARFLALNSATRAHRFLARLNLVERLGALSALAGDLAMAAA